VAAERLLLQSNVLSSRPFISFSDKAGKEWANPTRLRIIKGCIMVESNQEGSE
jgi:hypothetical protein